MMKAMIFAAGLGTRLFPLTSDKPKALVKVQGVPLLEIVIRRLIRFGYTDILVNVHHFAKQVIRFLEEKQHFAIRIAISDERGQLLETGGGLKKASWFFDDGQAFLLHNADVLSDIDLNALRNAHLQSGALATLAVRRRQSSRYLLFDRQQILHGWVNVKSGDMRLARQESQNLRLWAFSGIHMISPKIFGSMPKEEVFSIIDLYLKTAGSEQIMAFPHDDSLWVDVGKIANLEKAEAVAGELL